MEDTIIGEQAMEQLVKDNPILDFSFEDDYREEVKLITETAHKAGILKGRKEVVEKVDKMVLGLKAICLPSEHRLMGELEEEWLQLKIWFTPELLEEIEK